MQKIVIVGAGRVGEAAAVLIAAKHLCREVVLLDIREGPPQGVALDVLQNGSLVDSDTRVTGTTDPAALQDAELVIVTAGFPRKPGMSRSDVLGANVEVIDQNVDHIMEFAPDSILLMVTNPVDTLTYRAWKRTGWDRSRVFGQAGVLDSARMATFISEETGFSVADIASMVLGGHGDSMVPLPRYCTINGVPVERFLEQERIEAIIQRTRDGGAEVLGLRQNSSAYNAPGAAVCTMVEAMVLDRKRLLPCVALLEGEFGQDDVAVGVPCVLGRNGIERVIDIGLDTQERENFENSVQAIRKDLALLPD